MIYDCFTWFDELDILEIRLNTLDSIIDCFVIIEADSTHAGTPKEARFLAHSARFEKFMHKISYHFVHLPSFSHLPTIEQPWARENYQRNYIKTALLSLAKPSDIVIIADVDEIPRPQSVAKYAKALSQRPSINTPRIEVLACDIFYFYLNNLSFGHYWYAGAKMLTFGDLCDDELLAHWAYEGEARFLIPSLNVGTSASRVRMYNGNKQRVHYPCGWHLSYMGGVDCVIKKLDSFSHQEWRNSADSINAAIAHNASTAADCGGGGYILLDSRTEQRALQIMRDSRFCGYKLIALPPQSAMLPPFVRANADKYAHLLLTESSAHFVRLKQRALWWQRKIYRICKLIARFMLSKIGLLPFQVPPTLPKKKK